MVGKETERNIYQDPISSLMESLKDTIVAVIGNRAIKRAGQLSRKLLKAAPEHKEAIAAGIQIEKQLADACMLCLE